MGRDGADADREIAASAFKVRCLALLDEVAETGVPFVVTKRGKPVARLVPVEEARPRDLLGSVSYEREQDLLSPVDDPWEAER